MFFRLNGCQLLGFSFSSAIIITVCVSSDVLSHDGILEFLFVLPKETVCEFLIVPMDQLAMVHDKAITQRINGVTNDYVSV